MQISFNNILFSSSLNNAYEANLIFLGIENINSLRQENYQSNNILRSSVIDILARKVFLLFKVLFFSDFSEKLNGSFVVLSELKRQEKAEQEEKRLLMANFQKDNAHILENVDRQIAEFNKKVDALSQLPLEERIEGLEEILAQVKNFQEEQVKAHKESIDKYKQMERNRENKIPGFTVKTLEQFKSYFLAQQMSNIGETALIKVGILMEGMQKKMSTMTTLKRIQQVAKNSEIAAEIAAKSAAQSMQEAELAAGKTEAAYIKAHAAIARCKELISKCDCHDWFNYNRKAWGSLFKAEEHANKIGQIIEITKIAASIDLLQSPLNHGYKVKLLYASQLSSEQRAAHCSSINEIYRESGEGILCKSGSLEVYPTLLAVDENNKVRGYLFLGCKNKFKEGVEVQYLSVNKYYRSHQEHLDSRLLVLAFLTAELMEASTAWLEFNSMGQHGRSMAHFYQTKMDCLDIRFTYLSKKYQNFDDFEDSEHFIKMTYSIKGISARLSDIVRGIRQL